ncbi:MAG: hypothetical protein AAF297_07660 [Planctomycetota bacterium]
MSACPNCAAAALGTEAVSICTECATATVAGTSLSLPLLIGGAIVIGVRTRRRRDGDWAWPKRPALG